MEFDKETEGAIETAMNHIEQELRRALGKYGPFTSSHEGYAVLLEEVDELWHEVKNNKGQGTRIRQYEEARQVGAMSAKFLIALTTSSIK